MLCIISYNKLTIFFEKNNVYFVTYVYFVIWLLIYIWEVPVGLVSVNTIFDIPFPSDSRRFGCEVITHYR